MSCTGTEDTGLKLLTSPPVFDSLYTFCSPGDLCRIARTCNGASQAVADYLKHRFTVDLSRLLLRFFVSRDEVLDFRRLQAKYQFLISGSTALQLLDRTIYPNSDLDLYLFPNDAKAVGRWLIEHGYTFHSSRNAYPKTFVEALNCMPPLKAELDSKDRRRRSRYNLPGIRAMFDFVKVAKRNSGPLPTSHVLRPRDVTTGSDLTLANKHIQLIVTDMSPYEAILRAHSTVVMNVITWNRAIALFPLATLEQRRGVVTHNSGLIYHDWAISKYERRGFSFPDPLARFGEHLDRGSFKAGHRFFGDEHSWVVRLDTAGIDPPKIPVAVEGNSWELEWDNKNVCFKACTRRFIWMPLQHKYCVGDGFYENAERLLGSTGEMDSEELSRHAKLFNEYSRLPLVTVSSRGRVRYSKGQDVQIFRVLQRHFRDAREVAVLAERLKDL